MSVSWLREILQVRHDREDHWTVLRRPTDAPRDPAPDNGLMAAQPAPLTEEMLEDLYRTHAKRCAAWFHRLGLSGGQVEDLVHEVFVVAMLRRSQFRGESAPSTWLWGIARNVARSRRRSESRRLRGEGEAARESIQPAEDPLDTLCRRESAARVRGELETLSARDQELIRLCVFEERSGTEVAELTGSSRNAVLVGLHRARARLEKRLVQAGSPRSLGQALLVIAALAGLIGGSAYAAYCLLAPPAKAKPEKQSAAPAAPTPSVVAAAVVIEIDEPLDEPPPTPRPRKHRSARPRAAPVEEKPSTMEPWAILEQAIAAREAGEPRRMHALLLEHRALLDRRGFTREVERLLADRSKEETRARDHR